MKFKKYIFIPVLVILCVILYAAFAKPAIETHTWVLFSAQQADPPYFVVAHGKDFDASNIEDTLFNFSKPIELICEAKDGKLVLTDKTNSKTYEGTYKITSRSSGRFQAFKGETYSVVIDEMEGTANISSGFNRTLFISVGDYYLNFEVQ